MLRSSRSLSLSLYQVSFPVIHLQDVLDIRRVCVDPSYFIASDIYIIFIGCDGQRP